MKKKLFEPLLLLVTLFFLCFCHMSNRPVYVPSHETVTEIPAEHIAPSASRAPALTLNASGACLMDTASGRILYGKKESVSLPMASTTKIMTCLLALENGNMEDSVTFTKKAASMPKVHLAAGEGRTFLLKNLLYSLMLESHNDTAAAIAEHIGGSIEGFAAMMNAKAAELGMNHTNFVTPNGLDADGHASTPADMCRLASYACSNKEFLKIVQTPSITIRDTTGQYSYSLTNRDAFLTSYPGAIGLKTGFTNKAGYCFVGAAKREDRTLVSCVLASGWPPNKSFKWADTKALMNFGFDHFHWQKLQTKDLSSFYLNVFDGKSDAVGIQQPSISQLLLGDSDTVDITYTIAPELSAPVKTDVPIGNVTVSVNQEPIADYPLFPDRNIRKKHFLDYLYDTLHSFFSF